MFIGFILLALTSVSSSATLPDTALTTEAIQAISIQHPDKALLRIKESHRRHLISSWEADAMRAVVYSESNCPVQQLIYLKKVLSNDTIKHNPQQRLKYLTQTISALELSEHFSEAIDSCVSAINLASKSNALPREIARIYSVMASIYVKLDRNEDAIARYHQAEQLLRNANGVRDLAELSTIYGEEMTVLYETGDLKGMLEIAPRRESLIKRMAGMAGPPTGYIDQQRGFLYAKWALALEKNGNTADAARKFALYQATDMATTGSGASFGVPYLLASGQYAEALKFNDRHANWFLNQSGINDTINYEWLMNLQNRADALTGLGLYQQANAVRKRAYIIQDSIYARERRDDIAKHIASFKQPIYSQYANGNHIVNAGQPDSSEHFSLWEWCIISVIIFAITATGLLYRRISHLRHRKKRLIINSIIPVPDDIDSPQPPSYEAYRRIMDALEKDNMLSDPTLSRDKLLAVTGISRNNLGTILRENTNASNFSDFIARLRCEHAINIMSRNPNYSMQAISDEAGFGSRSTFYRAFQNIYNMTPIQYMDMHNNNRPSNHPTT